ncbi:MAG TPA: hypothetical protein VGR64_02375, partial [Terracidiphilus sp.]|nr:hypothetical protein [Terracidiphilus sp.]
ARGARTPTPRRCVLISLMSRPAARTPLRHAAALLLLSLLWAAGSLRADLLPDSAANELPPFLAGALPLAVLAVFAATIALLHRASWPRRTQALSALWIAFGLFLAPAWLVHIAQSSVPSFTRVALFALVPVFAVVLEPHLDAAAQRPSFSLASSLAAVLGMLLIFGLQMPSSFTVAASQAGLVVAALLVAAANFLAVRLARSLPPRSRTPFNALVAIIASAMLTASSLLAGEHLRAALHASALLWPAIVDLPALALLFWLFPRLSALRMTTRFLLAPLLAALLSLLIAAPQISLRATAGLLLVATSSAWLLGAPGESAPSDSPLGLTRD